MYHKRCKETERKRRGTNKKTVQMIIKMLNHWLTW